MNQPAIVVSGIHKSFGQIKALAGLDLTVDQGSILALLGPNGAGKTTLVRILSTLLLADQGSAKVCGFDVVHEADKLRVVLGLAGQFAAVDENLTGRENLQLVGRLYHLDGRQVRMRTDELLVSFDLAEAANRLVKTYSGGMRRRLDLAASLIGNPKVLFLDEPTTGLDPRSRLTLWEFIRNLTRFGTTILLTTQYLEEADHLADKITVIDQGRVVAEGTANQLKAKFGGDILEIHIASSDMVSRASAVIAQIGKGQPEVDLEENKISLPVLGTAVLAEVVRRLDQSKIEILDIVLRRPTLDEVFLKLTR